MVNFRLAVCRCWCCSTRYDTFTDIVVLWGKKSFEFVQISKQSLQYDRSMGEIGDCEGGNSHLLYDEVRHWLYLFPKNEICGEEMSSNRCLPRILLWGIVMFLIELVVSPDHREELIVWENHFPFEILQILEWDLREEVKTNLLCLSCCNWSLCICFSLRVMSNKCFIDCNSCS